MVRPHSKPVMSPEGSSLKGLLFFKFGMGKWKSSLAMTQGWLFWFEWINLLLGSLYRPHSKQMNYWYLGDKYHSKGKAVIDFSRQKERMKTMERELRKWRVHSLSQNPSPPFCLAFSFCFPCICLSLPVSDCLTGGGGNELLQEWFPSWVDFPEKDEAQL